MPITGILSSSDARRFLVLASPLRVSRSESFSRRSGWRAPLLLGVVQAVRSAAVLAKAYPFTFGCLEASRVSRSAFAKTQNLAGGCLASVPKSPVMGAAMSPDQPEFAGYLRENRSSGRLLGA